MSADPTKAGLSTGDVPGRSLSYLHHGEFSGSAISLREALESLVPLDAFDLASSSRRPSLLPARFRAVMEAKQAGTGVPWAKTGAWSRALQRACLSTGKVGSDRPTLFVQTLSALVLDERLEYYVYTDRVAIEGASTGGRFASRYSPAWLERERIFLQRARHIFVMGPSTLPVLIDHYGVREARMSVVGAGANMPLGTPRRSADCRRFLFVGTQWELKGGPELIAAFDRVRRVHPGIELWIVGSAPDAPVPSGARVMGRVPHERMGDIYRQVDAVVMPTHQEAFGIALIEALAHGLPCVGTTIGNQEWIIGDAGELIVPGDVGSIVSALRKIIAHYPDYAKRARERGREVGDSFTWDRVAQRIVNRIEGQLEVDDHEDLSAIST